MLQFVIFSIFITCVLGTSNVPDSSRIVGGETAAEGAFPYHVSIRQADDDDHYCSGVIIDEYWVISTAGCFGTASTNTRYVYAGTNKRETGGTRYNLEKMILHQEYDNAFYFNDIALLKVTEPIEFNDKVQPIKLTDIEPEDGVNCILSGWGTTANSTYADDLQFINLTTISLKKCGSMMAVRDPVVFTNLCTFVDEGRSGCLFDDGGPLVSNGKLIGIWSWIVDCAEGFPDVYTNIYQYLDWIEEKIRENS